MDEFLHEVQRHDEQIDLARAALAIARDEYPQLDASISLRRLDALAEAARREVAGGAGPQEMLAAIDRQLFVVEGFEGDATHYYDPRNSYLNEVIERRRGIPITLSVVYLEVGWRLGLDVAPIGFPVHFLVALTHAEPTLVIDPFHRGQRLAREELLRRLVPIVGEHAAPEMLPRALAPVPRREVLARILRNLKAIHVQAGDWPRALRVTDRLVTLSPEQPAQLRDRAQLYERLEAHTQACQDYARYLALAPEAEDAMSVRTRLERLRGSAKRLN